MVEIATEFGLDVGGMIGTPRHFPSDFTNTGIRGQKGGAIWIRTNGSVGEPFQNNAYCFVADGERVLTVRARLNGSSSSRNRRQSETHLHFSGMYPWASR
jgi:hypothetical protein